MDVGLHHHRPQGPVDATAWLQQRGEERPVAQLWDLELQIAGLGGQKALTGAVSVGHTLGASLVAAGADRLGRLQVDQGLEHQLHAGADNVQIAARA